MDLDRVRAFVTVAEERHFSRAAARLGVAQSGVSRQVRALEDALDAQLLERTSRSVTLTDAGAAALPRARALLAAADELAVAVRSGGTLRVGFVANTGALVAPVVAGLARAEPELDVDTAHLAVDDGLAGLRRGALDVLVGRAFPVDDDVVTHAVVDEPVLLALPEDHRLSGRDAIDARQLDGETFILVERAGTVRARTALTEWLEASSARPRALRETTTPFAALGMVSAGAGVYRLPASATIALPGVRYVALTDLTSTITLLHTAPCAQRGVIADAVRAFASAARAQTISFSVDSR